MDSLNKLAAGAKMADLPLEDIVRKTAGKPDQAGLINNAALVWNHTFFWKSRDFVQVFLDHLANWDFAASQLREVPVPSKGALA